MDFFDNEDIYSDGIEFDVDAYRQAEADFAKYGWED